MTPPNATSTLIATEHAGGPSLRRTPLDKAPEPDLGAELIPVERYIDPAFMKVEMDRVWSKAWLLAGPECDVREPGDYFVMEVQRESIIVARAEDGQLHAHYNVCRHRANQLRAAGTGRATSFQCAFHAWEWHLDGSLKHVPEAQDFPQGCPKAELALVPVRVDTWGGFVWINMDMEAVPLREYLGEIPAHLDPYEFEKMVLVYDETIEWNCNWKTSVDIFSETYHVRGVHPESEWVSDDIDVQVDLYGAHSRFIAPMYVPSHRVRDGSGTLPEPLKDYLKSEGFPADDYSGDIGSLRRDVAAFKRARSAETGLDFSKLHDEQLTADFHYNIFPNVTFNLFGEQMWMFRHRPHPTDPDRMYFDRMVFNRVPEGEGKASTAAGAVDMFLQLAQDTVEGRPAHTFYRYGERSSGLLLDQDASCLETVQKGLHSRGCKGLWISHHERRIRNFHRVLDAYVRGER